MSTVSQRKSGAESIGIDIVHYKVHDARLYSASFYNTIASGETQEIMIKTGANEDHIVTQIATSGQALISIQEGITSSVDGSAVGIHNMNRESTASGTTLIFSGPTWSTNTETLIYRMLIPGGAAAQTRVGSQARSGSEWIFKPSTKYLVQIKDQSGSTNTATINFEFYEED